MYTNQINRAPDAGLVSAAVTTAQIFPLASDATLACVLTCPASGVLDKGEFEVAATGYVTTAGAYEALITLYAAEVSPLVDPLDPASWTVIGAGTSRAVGTTSCPFSYRAKFSLDLVSGKLHGEFTTRMNNLVNVYAAISNVLTGIEPEQSLEPFLCFALGVTFNTGSAANIGGLTYFGLER